MLAKLINKKERRKEICPVINSSVATPVDSGVKPKYDCTLLHPS
jgi:hypothetical protein